MSSCDIACLSLYVRAKVVVYVRPGRYAEAIRRRIFHGPEFILLHPALESNLDLQMMATKALFAGVASMAERLYVDAFTSV